MSQEFLKIGGTDLSSLADIQNWKIDRVDVFYSWTDGNQIDHRDISRQRVEGSFSLGFKDAEAWASFQSLLAAARQPGGYYLVSVYVNTSATTEQVEAFLDYSTANKWDLVNGRFWRTISVTIKER